MAVETRSDSGLDIGIVGLGCVGERLGEQFRLHPEASIVAVSDPSPAAREHAAGMFELDSDRLFESQEAMLTTADLDAVTIASPNGLHYEQAMSALDHDCHVLLEKPIAVNVENGFELTRRAEGSDTVVMLGFQRHLSPAFIMGRERWALGEADPTFITGEITHDWRDHYAEMDDWRMNPELSGGGHLINVGIHVIEAVIWMTGLTPTSVSATVEFHDDAQRIDRQSSITMELENGTTATITDTGVVTSTREHVHVWDDDGALYVDGREWNTRHAHTIDSEGTECDPYHEDPQSKADAFIEAVATGGDPPSTPRDALWALAVTKATYESGRRDQQIELTERYPFLAELA